MNLKPFQLMVIGITENSVPASTSKVPGKAWLDHVSMSGPITVVWVMEDYDWSRTGHFPTLARGMGAVPRNVSVRWGEVGLGAFHLTLARINQPTGPWVRMVWGLDPLPPRRLLNSKFKVAPFFLPINLRMYR